MRTIDNLSDVIFFRVLLVNMDFKSVKNAFDQIETSINNLVSGVSFYGKNVISLSEIQNSILESAKHSDDTVGYLFQLTDLLISELERVESDTGSTQDEVIKLNKTIQQQRIDIERLNNELGQIQQEARTELEEINRRTSLQMNALTSLQNDLNAANSTMANTGAKMKNLNDTFQGIKRKRDEQLSDLQHKMRQRESLAGQLNSLSKEQSDLYQLLNAVNTLPDEKNPIANAKRSRRSELDRLNENMTPEQKTLASSSNRTLRRPN